MKTMIYVASICALLLCSLVTVNYLDRNPSINLSTKTCLVTGASSGVGRALAVQMVKKGWKVIGVARRTNLLATLQKQLGTQRFFPIECDTSILSQIHTASEKIRALGLHPTLFFLNAGMGNPQNNPDQLIPIHQKTFYTNYFGPLAWIDEWLPSLKLCGGGTFIATSSAMTFIALPGADAYSSSKAALAHCFESLRRQHLHENIGFASVFCGPIRTAMLKKAPKSLPFVHSASDEADYIITQVFAGKKNIYPSWVYTLLFKVLNMLPDWAIVKLTPAPTTEETNVSAQSN